MHVFKKIPVEESLLYTYRYLYYYVHTSTAYFTFTFNYLYLYLYHVHVHQCSYLNIEPHLTLPLTCILQLYTLPNFDFSICLPLVNLSCNL